MKWISAISVLFFGYAAAMQFNDPDAVYWSSIYAAIGACSLINAIFRPGKEYMVVPLVIAGLALIWGLLVLPEFDLFVDGKVLNIFEKVKQGEEERELFGLLLVFLFAILELFHVYLRSEPGEKDL